PGVKPPRLMTIHYAPRKILIIYLSPRHLCSMARGIILGIGDYFKERLSVTLKERQCLITGNKECWIYVVKQDR
ncbi:MAG: heme NO-binding domain-containing protein, partial [Magnetococcales bacterium]|nr:heme NO-binding domain-containing protein [Magnetococcales bacterium]